VAVNVRSVECSLERINCVALYMTDERMSALELLSVQSDLRDNISFMYTLLTHLCP